MDSFVLSQEMTNMSKICHINFLSEIPNLNKYDFIVSILTSWQFDVALAYIQSHKLTNGILIVESVPFSNSIKYRLTEEQVSFYEIYFERIYFCRNRKQPYKIYNLIKSLFSKKTGKPIFFLRPLPNISLRLLSNISVPNKNIHHIVLDEGLSSYVPLIDSLKAIYSNTFTVYKKWFIQIILNTFGSFFSKTKEDFGLFHLQQWHLIPNIMACNALKCLYYDRTTLKNKGKNCILIFKDYIVTPDKQSTQIIEDILAEIIENIIEGLKHSNVNIVIKKHPSDINCSFDESVLSKYPNTRIINSLISGEELVASYNPCVIVGGISNVVISSRFIFNIPVLSYSPLYLNKHIISQDTEKSIKYFIEQLKDYIFFCDDLKKINDEINNIFNIM